MVDLVFAGFLGLFSSLLCCLFCPLLLFLCLLGRGLAGRTNKLVLAFGADNPDFALILRNPHHLVTGRAPEILMGFTVPETIGLGFNPSAKTDGVVHDPAPSGHKNLIFLAPGGNIPGQCPENNPDPQCIGNQKRNNISTENTGKEGDDNTEHKQEQGQRISTVPSNHKVAQPVHRIANSFLSAGKPAILFCLLYYPV